LFRLRVESRNVLLFLRGIVHRLFALVSMSMSMSISSFPASIALLSQIHIPALIPNPTELDEAFKPPGSSEQPSPLPLRLSSVDSRPNIFKVIISMPDRDSDEISGRP
jgi:hypothetical protein